MRILWTANYISQSGYANQSRLFVPRLVAAGHHVGVAELSVTGAGMPRQVDGVNIMPVGLDPVGYDLLREHFVRGQYHALISLVDAWGLPAETMKQTRWFPITPVDTMPVAPAVAHALSACTKPVAISRFGQQQLKVAGFDAAYLPHAVDPSVWYPQDRQAVRTALGIPDDIFFAVFVGVNDSQPSRKGIPELLMAWQVFHQQHPGSLLYMHTATTGNMPLGGTHAGVNIPELIKVLRIDPQSVRLPDQYRYRTGIPAAELSALASAADVLAIPSRGEGFCLPLLEFARCGCPSITTAFAAQQELCFSGWLVEGEPEWNWQNAIVMKPGITALIERLLEARQAMGDARLRTRVVEHAREFDIDQVFARYAIPLLQEIAELTLDRIGA